MLRRTLEYADFKVKHVVNITDVGHLVSDGDDGEDKMEKGAARTGKSVWDVAQYYTDAFMKDWGRLGITDPSVWCKATDHIKEQIELVQSLEEKGYTYETSDGIYFDSMKFERYPDFARIDVENLQEGARIDKGEKKNITDFALWKHSPKNEIRQMEWPSPWGIGFPGWHIECSAMAMHHCGATLDIHCGGTDHVKIHHTNEIAQSECHSGETFSRFWMHGEFLRTSESHKMSKSSGDFLTLSLLIEKGYHPMEYRFFNLQSHYRNFLNFSFDAMNAAKKGLKKLRQKTDPLVKVAYKIESEGALRWKGIFEGAVFDDLNAPRALGILNSMLKDDSVADTEKGALILDFDKVFGLGLGAEMEVFEVEKAVVELEEGQEEKFAAWVEERNTARANKDYAKSDEIRDLFKAEGYVLKDSPEGTVWEKL